MYSYMGLILAIIVGISVGLSYLITEYFFRTKELELNDKGGQVAMMVRYFDAMHMDKAILREYLTSMDQLVGARIWVFNNQFELIGASETGTEYEQTHEPGSSRQEREARRREKWMQSVAAIDRQIRENGNGHERFQKILTKVYSGERVNERIYHPYYKEQVLMVGIPLKDPVGNVTGALLLASPLGGLNKVLKDIYIYTIIVGIIALFVSVIIVSGLTRRMVKPLISMKNSAKAIALGDYSLKVAVDGDDEIADLGRSLNSLGRDLEQFVLKSQKMEKMRRDFVANVSHELRTPITIIQGYNEALSDGTITDPEDVKKYRKLINDETRRLERLINNSLSGFPSFLVKHSGLNSGFMITQYAAAALVSENKVLAHPASVDSIPSCENQEDLVSMGAHAARKAGEIAFNARRVVATEILAACQAIDLREGEGFKLGAGTQAAYDAVRKSNDFIAYDKDIEMFKELEKITNLVQEGGILDAVEDKVDLKFF